jgi:hypothetical protein
VSEENEPPGILLTYFKLSEFTDWDITCFADKVKNPKVAEDGAESKTDLSLHKYFEQMNFGDLTEPTTILDMHGRIMVWALPGMLHPNRLVRRLQNFRCLFVNASQADYNVATKGISAALKRGRELNTKDPEKTQWCHNQFKMPDVLPTQFESGIADFVSGWFMQGHTVGVDMFFIIAYSFTSNFQMSEALRWHSCLPGATNC